MLNTPGAPPILVGVDFSDCALAALREARALAEQLRLPCRVIHVRERLPGDTWPDQRATEWLDRAGLRPDQVRLREGQPWIELAREARESGAGVLFVGGHGRSGAQPIQLGSTTVRLGLTAPCPLVVVGPRAASAPHAEARWNPAAAVHVPHHRG